MRDPKTEQQLNRGGFKYRFEQAFAISRIDINAAKRNPARLLRQIEEERCVEMACAMEAGVDFPAIVLIEDVNSFTLATGLHRLIAATQWKKPPLSTFDAYLIGEADSYRREVLIRSINTIEGKGQSRDENLAHCVEVMRMYPGHTVDDVAAAFSLSGRVVREHLRQQKAEKRAYDLGIGQLLCDTKLFAATVKGALNTIKPDPLFIGTIRAISETHCKGAVSAQFISDVAAAKSEAAGFKVIEERKREHAEAEASAQIKWAKRRSDIPTKALAKVKSILRMPHALEPSLLQFGALEITQLARDTQAVQEVIDILTAWKREMLVIQKMHEKSKITLRSPNGGGTSANTSSPKQH